MGQHDPLHEKLRLRAELQHPEQEQADHPSDEFLRSQEKLLPGENLAAPPDPF